MADIYKLEPDTILELFRFYSYNLSNLSESFYFANHTGIAYQGNNYTAIPCEGKGFDYTSQGVLPTPSITVSNLGRIIGDFIYLLTTNANYRLEGAFVERILTQRRFLDGEEQASASIREMARSRWRIVQVPQMNYKAIEFNLGVPFDVEGEKRPRRQCLKQCDWTYRGEECGYIGAMYTITNQPTSDPTKDICAKTLAACQVRFGAIAPLPFGGFPSVGGFY